MVVLTSFPLTRGSVDFDDIFGREIGRQGTGDVNDHHTRPMSPTSVASEHFRYFRGIASIFYAKPYHTLPAPKSCRQYNSPVNSGMIMGVVVVFMRVGSVGKRPSGGGEPVQHQSVRHPPPAANPYPAGPTGVLGHSPGPSWFKFSFLY
eukprot:scaffold10286_cov120-Skeletonema_marinoi.AAC.3